MSRQIKFRGISVETGEWVYGSLVKYSDNARAVYLIDMDNPRNVPKSWAAYYDYVKVKPETVGQYIGEKDKDDVEIYEGDGIENYAMKDIVTFHNGAFVGINSAKDTLGQHQPIAVHNELKIIGNIHENPELMEASK